MGGADMIGGAFELNSQNYLIEMPKCVGGLICQMQKTMKFILLIQQALFLI